jgi:transcriptional regulator with XRE-family HTH domain
MITREELGRRLRETRTRKGMTLKQLDEASGFSATHISEIERGKTSPTIGALLRIAGALGKPPSYFIESETLPETAFVPANGRVRLNVGGVAGEMLTPGIPGGRLRAAIFWLEPGGPALEIPKEVGEECGYVIRGEVEFSVGRDMRRLLPGFAIHHATYTDRVIRAVGTETAEIVMLGMPVMVDGVPAGMAEARVSEPKSPAPPPPEEEK